MIRVVLPVSDTLTLLVPVEDAEATPTMSTDRGTFYRHKSNSLAHFYKPALQGWGSRAPWNPQGGNTVFDPSQR